MLGYVTLISFVSSFFIHASINFNSCILHLFYCFSPAFVAFFSSTLRQVVLLNQVTTKFAEGSFQLTLALGMSFLSLLLTFHCYKSLLISHLLHSLGCL